MNKIISKKNHRLLIRISLTLFLKTVTLGARQTEYGREFHVYNPVEIAIFKSVRSCIVRL